MQRPEPKFQRKIVYKKPLSASFGLLSLALSPSLLPPVRREESMSEGEAKTENESKKRKKGEKKIKKTFIYGNYNSYYGYRIDRNQEKDPRLAVFKKELFEGKDYLDIGCNQGLITTSFAKKFLCRNILGIDIDAGLIETAHWNLRRLTRMGYAQSKREKISQVQVPSSADCSDQVVSQVAEEE